MIRLKTILEQSSIEEQVDSLLDKIKNKQFERIGAGDNGIVYAIQGTDYVFKITRERDEFEVASVIVGRESEFTCFVPVVYVNDSEKMYIMRNADPLPSQYKTAIDNFYTQYTKFALDMQGEVSIFDYLDAEGARETEKPLVDFLRRLQSQVQRTGIAEFDLDLDFKSDNVMTHQSKMVLVDW
tara:strand:+ start:2872 stop:3420 length:549 start_codon:yes stop_codon:yes gene_type:complete